MVPRALSLLLVVSSLCAAAEASGRIQGQVTGPGGEGLPGVRVSAGAAEALTDEEGSFSLEIPAGTYELTFSLGAETVAQAGVEVREGETARVDRPVEWLLNVAESITVTSASRRRERIVEAPAAVTVVTGEEAARQSSHGQVPKLLELAPGVELTQSGLYDFNFNLRGFNTSLNRRVLVLIDGRDPSLPFLGSQEWSAFSFPLYDVESVELVRGPASALYGSDAFNGVLNLVTRSSREGEGGTAQLTFGELSTRRLDARYSRPLGGGWYAKLVGGIQESEDFARSRVGGAEYEGLPLEAIPLPRDTIDVSFGGLRLDKELGQDSALLTLEGGTASSQGSTFLTNIGRVQATDVRRPWVRMNLNTRHWNLLAARSDRDADGLVSLGTGGDLYLDSYRANAELQGNAGLWQGKGRLVGGASFTEIDVDSADPRGVQTLMHRPERERRQGLFGQVDSDLGDRLKAVAALRWDKSSLREGHFSPKAALVWAVRPGHTLRLSYNEAFQSPNFGELFTRIQVARPLDLSALEQALAPALGGTSLGLGNVPFLALGNDDLDVEEVRSYELGYSAVAGRNLFLTVDVYRSEVEGFVSTLLPQLGTSLGRLNPDFGPYQAPRTLPPQVAALVISTLASVLPPELFALLSNDLDGSPIFATLSFVNVGRVDTQGMDVALQWSPARGWSAGLSWSHLDFEVREEAAENPILPNAADDRVHLSLSYVGERFDSALGLRWADGFFWRGGIFQGRVPSYQVVDWSANFQVSDRWSVGLSVANLLDEEHIEIFGGDFLGRRALGHLTFSW